MSRRARVYSMIWLRNEPFDGHDWIVDRGDRSGEKKYVIEALQWERGQGDGNGSPSMYSDVKPALEDLDSAQDRVTMFCKNAFPGIARLMNYKSGHDSASADSVR